MILKAKYADREKYPICYVNTDFIVDVFEHKGNYIAYTFDNERCGYIIEREVWERYIEVQNESRD